MNACSYAACRRQANAREDEWDFCSVHLAQHRLDTRSEAEETAAALERTLRAGAEVTQGLPDGAARLRSLVLLPIDAVEPHPLNVRDSVGDLRDLVDSIESMGILEPLVAVPRGGRYRLIAGHRRLAAARKANLTHVPVLVRPELTDEQIVEAMLVENMQRVDLTPLEQARAIRGLVDLGRSQRQVAAAIGKTEFFIGRRLILLELPADIQGRLNAKEITEKEAVEIARHLRNNDGIIRDNGWDKPHFGPDHPLADAVTTLCAGSGHSLRRRVGRVACGACWEQVIRDDAVVRHAAGAA